MQDIHGCYELHHRGGLEVRQPYQETQEKEQEMIRWTIRRHDNIDPDNPYMQMATEIEEDFIEDYKKNLKTKLGPELAIVQAMVQEMALEVLKREEDKK